MKRRCEGSNRIQRITCVFVLRYVGASMVVYAEQCSICKDTDYAMLTTKKSSNIGFTNS